MAGWSRNDGNICYPDRMEHRGIAVALAIFLAAGGSFVAISYLINDVSTEPPADSPPGALLGAEAPLALKRFD